jgi:RNA polymerase sigma factor (sigma-70 family)
MRMNQLGGRCDEEIGRTVPAPALEEQSFSPYYWRSMAFPFVPEFSPPASAVTWSDERLVHECLQGNEQAWSALLQKYRNLIFSIPLRYHLPREDAADVFQTVSMELFSELPRLRKVGSLRSWLITVTARQALHSKRRRQLRQLREGSDLPPHDEPPDLSPSFIEGLEREQLVREAVARLNPRCQELVRLLFFEQPAIPYKEVADRLGLSTGSIGFIRGRCLERLKRNLERKGP